MIYLGAFLGAGIVCLLGQMIYQYTKMSPGHITSMFVVIGAFLDTFGIYDKFIELCDMGASVIIPSFGHSLIHGALECAKQKGVFGILLGMFDLTAVGITCAILFAFITAMLCRMKT
mgnify:CR=1 FL=1